MMDAEAVLVEAALRGDPQLRRVFHGKKGDCALGILHKAIPGHASQDKCSDLFRVLKDAYGMDANCCRRVIMANDYAGWDFLTIARKMFGGERGIL